MVPAQEKRLCWGIGEEGGESNEASGEFGQESGEGGHRSMLCKIISLSQQKLWLSSGEANDLPLTESEPEPETDLGGAKRGLVRGASEVAADPGDPGAVGEQFQPITVENSSSYNGPLSHTSALEVPNHYQTASQY